MATAIPTAAVPTNLGQPRMVVHGMTMVFFQVHVKVGNIAWLNAHISLISDTGCQLSRNELGLNAA